MGRKTAYLWLVAGLLWLTFAHSQAHGETLLTGQVTDIDGQPLAGIFITAQNRQARVEMTAITDDEGLYQLPVAHPGTLTVNAHQVGYVAGMQAVKVEAGDTTNSDFMLIDDLEGAFWQVPDSSLLNLLPEGDAKRDYILDCAGCHHLSLPILRQNGLPSQEFWLAGIQKMQGWYGPGTGFPIMGVRDAEATAQWLVAALGSDELPAVTLPPAITGEAAQVLITEYDSPDSLPHDLIYDEAAKNVVVTGMNNNVMYVLDPQTAEFERVAIPGVSGANPRALELAADGSWWVVFGYPQKIGHYDPVTETWEVYNVGMYPHSIALLEDGTVWVNGHFSHNPILFARFDPRYERLTRFTVPPAENLPPGELPIAYEVRAAPDGAVWGSDLNASRVYRFDPTTETFTVYPLPDPLSGPRRLDIAPDGMVWIPEFAGGNLTRLDPTTGEFTQYPVPTQDALPYIARVSPQGMVYVGYAAGDAIARFDPTTETWVEFRLPTRHALIRHFDLDDTTGDLWLAYSHVPDMGSAKIARVQFLS